MSHELNTESLKRLLTCSVEQTDLPTQAKLRQARERALSRYDARQTAPSHAWIWARVCAWFWGGAGTHRAPIYGACAVLLVAGLVGSATWWQQQRAEEHEDIAVDIAILTDEMPVNVYAN